MINSRDLDALIERLLKRLLMSCKACPECGLDRSHAAAAITDLRAEVARLHAQASAVVVIMPPREPTQEMDDAASNVDLRNLPGVFRRQVWRAMWDASGVAKASVITGNKP